MPQPGRISRRALIVQAAAATAGAAFPRRFRPAPRRPPNVLLIVSDDLGYADLSGFGRPDYRTPALDRLAAGGVRLTAAYSAAPVCSPTRVGFMTGRYPARTEVGLLEPLTTEPIGLSPEQSVLARGMKAQGYRTALIGKWHLGRAPRYRPLRHGFDEFYGFLGPALDYVSHRGRNHQPDLFDGDTPVAVEGYLTDLFTARALATIDRWSGSPFFISLQYNSPHWPWQPPGTPAYPDAVPWTSGGSPAAFGRMVGAMDRGVGAIVDRLKARGLERDTLIIFTSDNGGERFSDMGPYSNSKFSLWEGGIRVAAIARWPGVIQPGRTTRQAAISMDWTATALAAGGGSFTPPAPLDGIDLLPVLRGERPPISRDLFWRTIRQTRQRALRSGTWKYLVTETGAHLFDLERDPGERHDLRRQYPAIFERLEARYAAWESTMLPPERAPARPG